MGCGFNAGQGISGIDLLECAFADADAVKTDVFKHTDHTSPNIEAIGRGTVCEIGETVQNRGIHCEVNRDAENRNG